MKIPATNSILDTILTRQQLIVFCDNLLRLTSKKQLPRLFTIDQAAVLNKYITHDDDIKSTVSQLIKLADQLPQLNLTIAFNPTLTFIHKIYQQLTQKLSTNFVINITVDPNLIGGVIVDFKGNHTDLSVKKSLDQIKLSSLIKL